MNITFYKNIVQQLKTAYAYHKIICGDDGVPNDYEFIEVNVEFEKLTGLKGADISGRRISEVLPGIKTDEFDWISIYGDVALHRSEREFEQYSESLKKLFRVKVFSPRKYHFITLFDELALNNQTANKLKMSWFVPSCDTGACLNQQKMASPSPFLCSI